MFGFKKYRYICRNTSLFFSVQMSVRIIAELLKNAPVLLKCFESFWKSIPIYLGF